jgi:two-component system, sensor histidine kinase YesM
MRIIFRKIVPPTFRKASENDYDSVQEGGLGDAIYSGKILRNRKVQSRLIISFLLLSLIPLLITGVFAYNLSSKSIKSKISTYSVQITDQVNKSVERTLADLIDFSEELVYSDNVQKALDGFEGLDDNQKLSISNQIIHYIESNISTISSVSDIKLITKTDDIIFYKRLYLMPSDELNRLKKIAEANEGVPGFAAVKLEFGRKGIALTREIYSVKTFDKIGFLTLAIDGQSIADIFSDTNLGKGAEIFIIDATGAIVSDRNPRIGVNGVYKDSTLIKDIIKHRKLKENAFKVDYSGERSLVTFSYIKSADWYIVCTIPFSYLNSDSTIIGVYTTLLGLICFLFSGATAFLISRSISVPLKKLIKHMNEVKKGNLKVQIEDNCKDEISEVTLNFNIMIREIEKLIGNIRENERQKASEKLRVLQAQINPHFLSNTLNTVKWLATVQNAENISNLVTSLIKLLHVSMGIGDELVSIEKEIDYIKNYITIQEYRYCDKFTVEFDIDEEILKCKIPKFSVQPVVENAIIHGIEPMEGKGLIWIKAARSQDEITLTVTDNGVGFIQGELNDLVLERQYSSKNHFSGIGIKNVDERIKLVYGEEYGISIESIPQMYTKVKIKIPALYEGK